MDSPIATYRYILRRDIAPLTGTGTCLFVMLNPSTADERKDDATIRKVKGFCSRWDVGKLEVVNLFAVRSTDPSKLKGFSDPVGPLNDTHLLEAAAGADRIIAAWGGSGPLRQDTLVGARAQAVCQLLGARELLCLDTTNGGWPRHPLYMPYDVGVVRYSPTPAPPPWPP